jgi:protein-tyrosine phosphatase
MYVVDVQDLPESSLGDITIDAVNAKLRDIDQHYQEGDTVLVRCRMGISRSCTIAYLYALGTQLRFSAGGCHPNEAWTQFRKANYTYYKNRQWRRDSSS